MDGARPPPPWKLFGEAISLDAVALGDELADQATDPATLTKAGLEALGPLLPLLASVLAYVRVRTDGDDLPTAVQNAAALHVHTDGADSASIALRAAALDVDSLTEWIWGKVATTLSAEAYATWDANRDVHDMLLAVADYARARADGADAASATRKAATAYGGAQSGAELNGKADPDDTPNR